MPALGIYVSMFALCLCIALEVAVVDVGVYGLYCGVSTDVERIV
jgi:hypothetical protein